MTQSLNSRVNPTTVSGEPIRVLVVDDSSVIRGIVSRWIEASADMVLAGAAVNGSDAIKRAATLRPDIIILDIEMPEMDGITALPQLLKLCPQSRIIMASTLTRRNAEISLKALSLGASDYVPKPTSISGGDAAEDFKRELMTRIVAGDCWSHSRSVGRHGGVSACGQARRNSGSRCSEGRLALAETFVGACPDHRHRVLDGWPAGACAGGLGTVGRAERAGGHHAAHAADLYGDPCRVDCPIERSEVRRGCQWHDA
jgi:CheY-like chemotaxis protein